MDLLLLIVIGLFNVVCFVIGAKVGQAVTKGEKVEMPKINPLTAIKEHNAKKEVEKQQEKLDKVMRNIERYDGTSKGQEVI